MKITLVSSTLLVASIAVVPFADPFDAQFQRITLSDAPILLASEVPAKVTTSVGLVPVSEKIRW